MMISLKYGLTPNSSVISAGADRSGIMRRPMKNMYSTPTMAMGTPTGASSNMLIGGMS